MNNAPNTVHWQTGAHVIHDKDAKQPEMLMAVTGYDKRTGECITRYLYPHSLNEHMPNKRCYRNDISVLHDPVRFGISEGNTYANHKAS